MLNLSNRTIEELETLRENFTKEAERMAFLNRRLRDLAEIRLCRVNAEIKRRTKIF